MEITIHIKAPELAHAIETLAIAIGCTVDKIGVGEAIKEAVDQGPKEPKEDEKVTKKTEKAAETPEETEVITIEEVREAFLAKNTKSNKAKLKAILEKQGVVKVTDLPEDSFPEVLKELEAI